MYEVPESGSRIAQEPGRFLRQVVLEVAPHPELSETQAKVIALDYGMRGGSAKIKVRRALLYYALRRLGLDTDPAARRPQDQQIVLMNAPEIGHSTPRVSAPVSGGVNG